MILMMEKQSMRPNPQAPKKSTFARHNLYAELLMQLVHRNLFLVIFDFSFQRRTFLEPSDYEAFTLNCSIFLEAHIWMERLSSAFINIKTVLSSLLKRGFSRWIRSMHMELLLIRSRKFLFQFLPTTTHFEFSFNLLTSHIFDNICTISFPKVKPTSEQGIMMDVFRGAASIAFCLLSIC